MNLIKMNLHRFFRIKAVYVLMVITMLLVVFTVLDGRSTTKEELELYKQIETENGGPSENLGISISILDEFGVEKVASEMIASQLLLVIIAVFVSYFFNEERAKGYLKNLNSCTNHKVFLFLSKIPVVCVLVILLFADVWLGAAISCDHVLKNSMSDIITFNLFQILLHIAFGIFICMINELFRKQILGVIFGVLAAVAVPSMLVSSVMNMIPGLERLSNICFFMTAPMVSQIRLNGSLEIPVFKMALFMLTVFLGLIYAVIGSLSIQKRDIY